MEEEAKKTGKRDPDSHNACPLAALNQEAHFFLSSRLPSRFRAFAVAFLPRRLEKNLTLFGKSIWCAVVAGSLIGCVDSPKHGDFGSIQKDVSARTGYAVQWRGVTAEDAAVDDSIRAMLSHPLSADEAVQIALLNNRTLQGTYEDLGIAQADLVQAGLLKNPVFSAGIRFPTRSPKRTYLDFSVEEDFIDVLFLPARSRLAGAQFDQAKARVIAAVIQLAADTRSAYFSYQAAQQMRELRQSVLQAQSASFDAARRLDAAGNITALSLLGETSQYDRARLELSTAEGELADARERLTDLMGLWGADTAWSAQGRLPELPATEVDPHGLESLAMRQRADLEAARQEVMAQARTLGFAQDVRFLTSLTVGPEAERETDGQWRIGPSLSLPVPIFDQGQATVARAVAVFRQSQQRYFALAVSIRSQVRAARSRMYNARDRVLFYRRDVLPVQQKLLEQTQLEYNGMLVGVFQLLQARREQIEAGGGYVTALHDYWIARTELERAVGGRLPVGVPATQP
jgi:cobalt-zinc-cadmium efflux system outer membrane protein